MYVQQLNETEHRRRLAEAEVTACESILKKNMTRMTDLASRREPVHPTARLGELSAAE